MSTLYRTALDVPSEFWQRYATRAPRYTSYPTAPVFQEDFDQTELFRRYRQAESEPIGVYVHVPFCKTRCLYCGCHCRVGQKDTEVHDYVSLLLAEADLLRTRLAPRGGIKQLALGGGTPNLLPAEEMTRLILGLKERFGFTERGERSIEIDPRTASPAYLDTLLELGFNRFSFGVQDFDPTVMRNVGRPQDYETVRPLVEHLQQHGVTHYNLDLLYGLPGQTEATMQETAKLVTSLNPSRLALFGYAHVPWIKPQQRALEPLGLPDESARVQLWGTMMAKLLDAGYEPVGMDHFAKPGDALLRSLAEGSLHRNFMGYTTERGLDLIGLGVSAISSTQASFAQNEKDEAAYAASIRKGNLPFIRGYLLNKEDELRREIIISLFCNFRLDFAPIEQRYRVSFPDHFHQELQRLEPLAKDGLLDITPTGLEVSSLGRYFIRNICLVFDQYLTGDRGTFSKTV